MRRRVVEFNEQCGTQTVVANHSVTHARANTGSIHGGMIVVIWRKMAYGKWQIALIKIQYLYLIFGSFQLK